MRPRSPAAILAALRMQVRRLAAVALSQRWRVVRRVALVCVGLVVVLTLAARLAFPLFVSAEDLGQGFSARIEQATGAILRIDGEPTLSLWPTPELRLSGVTLSSGGTTPPAVSVTARGVTVGFDVGGAFFGHPAYDGIRLSDAVVTVVNGASRDDATVGSPGLSALLAPEGGEPMLTGDLVIEGGQLRIGGSDGARGLSVNDIWGTVTLPGRGSDLRGDLAGMLHGVATTLSFRSSDPAALLSGANAPLSFAVTSPPATIRFDGVGVLSASPFVSGSLSVTAPTVGGLARLLGAEQVASNPLGPVFVEARLSTEGNDIKFDNVDLKLGETSGRGVLDLMMPANDTPMLSGTLAFDRIDLSTVLPVIGGLQAERAFLGAALEEQLSADIRSDLRLSAEEVHFASLTATRVAAGLRGAPGRLSLDIGDATVAGGRLSGTILVAAPAGEERRGGVDIHLRDAELETLSAAFDLGGPTPRGRATVSLALSSPDPILLAPLQSLTGRLEISATSGTISGLDPEKLTEMVRAGAVFSLSAAQNGAMPFVTLDASAHFEKGRLRLDTARLAGPEGSLDLRGVIDMPTGGLALAGRFNPETEEPAPSGAETNAETTSPDVSGARFFMGGTWPQAVVTPLSVLTPER